MKTFFESPLKFAEHLLKAAAAEPLALQAGLEGALKIIKRSAKQKIGHYQEASGPFQDWAELTDETKEDRLRKGYAEDDPLLRSGDLKESIVHEMEILEGVVGSKDPVMAYQEYGTPTIPPRPTIGPAAFENKEKIKAIVGMAAISGITRGSAVHESLGYNFTTQDE